MPEQPEWPELQVTMTGTAAANWPNLGPYGPPQSPVGPLPSGPQSGPPPQPGMDPGSLLRATGSPIGFNHQPGWGTPPCTNLCTGPLVYHKNRPLVTFLHMGRRVPSLPNVPSLRQESQVAAARDWLRQDSWWSCLKCIAWRKWLEGCDRVAWYCRKKLSLENWGQKIINIQ